MPQITLEYTSNVQNASDWDILVEQVHKIISKIVGTDIDNCKSRLLEQTRYFIGDGSGKMAFVHLHVAILEGRSEVLKQELGNMLLNLLQTTLLPENSQHKLQITVEIRDIIRRDYFKYPKVK